MYKFLALLLSLSVGCASANAERATTPFGESFETCLSQSALWSELEQAKIDSDKSALWPKNYSRVVGRGIVVGEQFSVTSYLNLLVQPTYSYDIISVDPGQGFEYRADANHPFRGGARIRVEDLGTHRVFSWLGSYDIEDTWWGQVRTFKDFVRGSFEELEKNLRSLEAQSPDCLNSPM